MKIKLSLLSLIILSIFLVGCSNLTNKPKVKIVILPSNDKAEFNKYTNWLQKTEENIETLQLDYKNEQQALTVIAGVDGVLLTLSDNCLNDANQFDSLELNNRKKEKFEYYSKLILYTINSNIPFLSICDIEQFIYLYLNDYNLYQNYLNRNNVEKSNLAEDTISELIIKKTSLLNEIIGSTEGYVKKNNFSKINNIPSNFDVNAIDENENIQAITLENPIKKGYFFAVNWDPTIINYKDPFSSGIAESFVENVVDYRKKSKPNINESSIFNDFMKILLWGLLLPVVIAGAIFVILYFDNRNKD